MRRTYEPLYSHPTLSSSCFLFFERLPADLQLEIVTLHAVSSLIDSSLSGTDLHPSRAYDEASKTHALKIYAWCPCPCPICSSPPLPAGLHVSRLARDATMKVLKRVLSLSKTEIVPGVGWKRLRLIDLRETADERQ